MNEIAVLLKNMSEKTYSMGTHNEEVVLATERSLGCAFGQQLSEYITTFGALSCNGVEFTGVGMKESSHIHIVNRTIQARKEMNLPLGFVVIEALGDGSLEICDMNDSVYFFAGETPEDGGITLDEYLIQRIRQA